MGGRLAKADVEFDLKHPILLPSSCHFSELVIRQYHNEVGHAGTIAIPGQLYGSAIGFSRGVLPLGSQLANA